MEGDWSSREGRLPTLDREGRTLSDSEYCLPSPPERDLSNIHLSQVSLDGGYGGDVSSEAGSSEIFHHCQQPSYAHSEGYYSYVSSTDSITPFIDRLKRELEFTEVQETSSSASSHGGTSLKWEESDTDTFVTPRERSANKVDCDSVWHFRGSSNDLISSSYRAPPTAISNSRLASPPLSTDSRITYSSRVPLFNNASYDPVSIDHTSRLGTQSNLTNNHLATGLSQSSRIQSNHNCVSGKQSRIHPNQSRSDILSYSSRLQSVNSSRDPIDVSHPLRLHSKDPTCDNSNLTRVQSSTASNKEISHIRQHKNHSQVHSSRINSNHIVNDSNGINPPKRLHPSQSDQSIIRSQPNHENTNISTRLHSTHNDQISNSNRIHSTSNECINHSNRIPSSHNESVNHSNRLHSHHHGDPVNYANKITSNHTDPLTYSSKAITSHSDSVAYSSKVHSESLNHTGRIPSNHSEPTNLSSRTHSSHADVNHSNRLLQNHNETSVVLPNKVQPSYNDTTGINHATRTHPGHSDSPNNNHSTRVHANHNDQSSLNGTSRGPTSHGSSSDNTSVTYSTRAHQGLSSSTESIVHSHSTRLSSHNSANDLNNTTHSSRISTHLNHSTNSESANIARSSRVPPPQRHLSQSVLYLSADHRKLFPISTYQPEPPRVVGAVSVSERVVELETRLGGLKAIQKKALLSYYQRHQATSTTPVPPPPPRRASSASDYLGLKGCLETSSTTSSSSQNSNSIKDSSSTSSANSLINDSSQIHSRSCGALSGISGPMIVGRSISVDDWVPARPPKGAHLRQTVRSSSPESGSGQHQQRPASPQQSNRTSPPEVPLGPDSNRVVIPNKLLEHHSSVDRRRPPSPEPPPPPPSPPQQYSDEPLPLPPPPEELLGSEPALQLPSRHPSPGPQVPTNNTEPYRQNAASPRQSQSSRKITTDPETTLENRRGNSPINFDIRPQKLTDISNQKTNPTLIESQMLTQYNHNGSRLKKNPSDKFSETYKQLNSDHKENRIDDSRQFSLRSSIEQKITGTEIALERKHHRTSPPNDRCSPIEKPLTEYNPSKDLKEIESLIKTRSENHLNTEHFTTVSDKLSKPEHPISDFKHPDDLQNVPSTKSNSQENCTQYNDCAITSQKDTVSKSPVHQGLSRTPSKEKLTQTEKIEKTRRSVDHREQSNINKKKSLLRKTSFRCSERIRQSIDSLQNSITSSSPTSFQQLPKSILPDSLLNDILTKDDTESSSEAITSENMSADIMLKELLTKNLSRDSLIDDYPCKDAAVTECTFNDKMTSDKVQLDEVSSDILSDDKWSSAATLRKTSPCKLSSGIAGQENKTISSNLSSFTSQCFGEVAKEDGHSDSLSLSDCDMEKASNSVNLDSSISVGSLQQKKEELVTRLSRKLSVLRAEAAAVAEETSANEELGEAVVARVTTAWGPREASRLRSHVADLGRLTALLLTLTTRLARADNALLALSSSHPDKGALETKRDRLAGQLEEARRLKEKVDKRNEVVTTKLRDRLTTDEYSDFMHFVSLKSKLLLDSREIADKIKLGEEQLQALQMTLSAVT